MINELMWLVLLLTCFGGVILSYKFFGKIGLFAWVAIAVILANIQVMKTVALFGFVTALGNILYGSLFLVNDILSEKYGEKCARKAVWVGFFVLIITTIVMQICLLFVPHESDMLSPSLQQIFGILPRITFASLTAYLISSNINVWIFSRIKKITKGKKLWLRNNVSTLLSQFVDNVIFTLLAFVGVFDWSIIISIFVTSYVLKFIVSILDTPFLYLAKKIKIKDD
ncbi:queuosine precursor transporter [Candidatus Woesearchaeota archaeon]|nr:queuosine precursor transporter [Candidatus Woesearchaeota archaeon]